MKIDNRQLIENILSYCEKRNITLKELADALNYPDDKFLKVATGKAVMRLTDIMDICDYFKISPSDIMC